MIVTADYELDELLHQGRNSRVYRGRRTLDGASVILKILNEDSPSPERRARFQQEFLLMRKLDAEGVLGAWSLETHQGQKVMVLEDFGGSSLDRLSLDKLPLDEWLALAIRITECLGQLHARRVIHKDINPSNIVWNRGTNQLKLIDLGNASELAQEAPELPSGNRFEGTPAYVAPEQTGRINRAIDYRSDFYSLGVAFYEMLAGRRPFASEDMLELVYAHIALKPVPLHEVNPAVPPQLGALVGKLMAKTAEDRYQSAAGISADLQACLAMLKSGGGIKPFRLGTHDASGRLHLPQKLYGRDEDRLKLLHAFERASRGSGELLLVAGYSGVGKTSLVREVMRPVAERRGLYAEGKFEQFKRDIPYAALIQSFRALVRQVLTRSEEEVAACRDRLLKALGRNARVLIELIPDLELITGPQPPIVVLPPEQAQNRFNQELRNFVLAFARPDQPLVLFLDDLQWADLPSLQVIALLLQPPAVQHLLLVGAYRDNEAGALHALTISLDEMAAKGVMQQRLALGPLKLPQIRHLLADTLHAGEDKVEQLAKLCLSKTNGNPFFLSRFLATLAAQGMLEQGREGAWTWSVSRIAQAAITDNVVDLMLSTLHALPGATRDVLAAAACLGTRFDLATLALLAGEPQDLTADLLWPALQEGVILPLNEDYRFVGRAFEGGTSGLAPAYRFLHDRVQQAADMLLDEAGKAARHLAIGRLWREQLDQAAQEDRLFDWVNHYNLGRSRLTDAQERKLLAGLNLRAARKARASIAYKPALGFIRAALDVVAEEDWDTHHELMFELHAEAAEIAYFNLDFALMREHAERTASHARSTLDRVQAIEIQIKAAILQHRLLDAIQLGITALGTLGVKLPRKPSPLRGVVALNVVAWRLRKRTTSELRHLPAMQDPHKIAACRLLSTLVTCAYRMEPRYLPMIYSRYISLVAQHGREPFTPFAFATYGVLLGSYGVFNRGTAGDQGAGKRFADIALAMLEDMGAVFCRGRTEFVVHGLVYPWSRPLRQSLEPLRQAHLHCMEMGDLEYGAHCLAMDSLYSFLCGEELRELEKRTGELGEMIEQSVGTYHRQRVLRQAMLALVHGPAAVVTRLPDELGDRAVLFRHYTYQLMLCYLFGERERAVDFARLARQHVQTSFGTFITAVYYFFDSLAHLSQYAVVAPAGRLQIMLRVASNQRRLRAWRRQSPANCSHKYLLVEAELARCRGRLIEAARYYDQAIAMASDSSFVHEAALARELAGEFHLTQGMGHQARECLRAARADYQRWGALAKVQQLEQVHREHLPPLPAIPVSTTHVTVTGTIQSIGPMEVGGQLDLSAVMKASQALSQEIVLARLLRRLLEVVMEVAGAQRAVLLLKKDEDWVVEAEREGSQQDAVVLQSVPLQEAGLPLALVHYVARVRQSAVVHEAVDDPLLAQDDYVRITRPRSLLCMPILHQGQLTAMLYLENNASPGAFTEQRLEVLRLLGSQVAISVENARLYADMEERVAQRTAELRALTLRDALTGIANRKAFDERLEEEIGRARRNGRPLALLLIDIDHFKKVNDAWGHQTGDECLKAVAAMLAASLSRPVDLAARYGGEEFAVLLPETDLAGANFMAQRLLQGARELPLRTPSGRHSLTVSIGVAVTDASQVHDGALLVAEADNQLYAAKAAGRDQISNRLVVVQAARAQG